MSGLLINFYQVEIEQKTIVAKVLNYSEYETKEKYIELRDTNPNCSFYREDEKILILGDNLKKEFKQLSDYEIDLNNNTKILSRIIENGFTDFFRSLEAYKVFKNKYSNTWEIISSKDIFNNSIQGLVVNRTVHFSPFFTYTMVR